MPRDSSNLLAVDLPGCPSAVGLRFLTTSYISTTLFTTKEHAFKLRHDATEKKRWCWIQHLQRTEFLQLVNLSISLQKVIYSVVLMFAIQLREDSSTHCKATIQRWVSAVQKHNGSCATRTPILCFPQRKQQKRLFCHCSNILR